MEAAPAGDLPLLRREKRTDLVAHLGRKRFGETLRVLRFGRLPVRSPLVPGRAVRPLRARAVPAHQPGDRELLRWASGSDVRTLRAKREPAERHRRLSTAHLLAERVQPDS